MAKVQQQKVSSSSNNTFNSKNILWKFCYYYPAYTYQEARKIPYKEVTKALEIAEAEKSKLMIDLTQVACAPYGKKNSPKKLIEHYKDIIERIWNKDQ